jgi:pimeloyl-ACP methyl ester carboxylesterase
MISRLTNGGGSRVDSDAVANDGDQAIGSLASEVLVFPRAVELALEFGQFYRPKDFESASALLDEAARRITVIESGGDWVEVVGIEDVNELHTIVGGYQSAIDGSYQPYGLVIPRGMRRSQREPLRLDLWFHGRGEKLSEVAFLSQQRGSTGQYTPEDTLVLHPYGRYSNAFKFAGEIDVLEVLDYVKRRLPIDEDRISVRGFSMGGAACWQFATHYADRWFAANPGAGFSETPEFLAFFQDEEVRGSTPWYQQKLWQLYDCPPWSRNLLQCPTIAYSGELDRQKQAADVMANALADVGIELVHVIGPQTEHKIHEASKVEIESRMSQLARRASPEAPDRVEFTTVSLRYHRMHWIEVLGLVEHWTPATVSATRENTKITVTTANASRIRFDFGPGQWTGKPAGPIEVEIDGQALQGPMVRSDQSWKWELERFQDQWRAVTVDGQLRKRPGLQGPIDDAFMDTFLFVLPSGKSTDSELQDWIDSESLHAMLHWRKHFRGDIRQKLDRDVNETDLASSNLILFGDIESNLLIRRIAPKLPVRWSPEKIEIGAHSVPRKGHAALMIYPNPLNQDRYVVLNSGFTFREYDYLNNARQTPKLPDWALVDIREGATTTDPGKVVRAGFFDERWQP